MVSIDGVDISGATIDGQEVSEITVDGDTVWTGIPASAVYYEGEKESDWEVGYSEDGAVMDKRNNHLYIKADGAGKSQYGTWGLIQTVDLSSYNTMNFEWAIDIDAAENDNLGRGNASIGVTSDTNIRYLNDPNNWESYKNVGWGDTSALNLPRHEDSIDISGVNGSYHVAFAVADRNGSGGPQVARGELYTVSFE